MIRLHLLSITIAMIWPIHVSGLLAHGVRYSHGLFHPSVVDTCVADKYVSNKYWTDMSVHR